MCVDIEHNQRKRERIHGIGVQQNGRVVIEPDLRERLHNTIDLLRLFGQLKSFQNATQRIVELLPAVYAKRGKLAARRVN